jgi:hypothetical protein
MVSLHRGLPQVSKVISAVHGAVPFKSTQDGIAIELPLDTVDVIKLYK